MKLKLYAIVYYSLFRLKPVLCEAAEPVVRGHLALKYDLDLTKQVRWEKEAATALQRSATESAAMVPRQTPFITCDCPSCCAQTYTRGPDRVLWEFEFPDRLTCCTCKKSFPNERFPNNRMATFLNTHGESVEGPCYATPPASNSFSRRI